MGAHYQLSKMFIQVFFFILVQLHNKIRGSSSFGNNANSSSSWEMSLSKMSFHYFLQVSYDIRIYLFKDKKKNFTSVWTKKLFLFSTWLRGWSQVEPFPRREVSKRSYGFGDQWIRQIRASGAWHFHQSGCILSPQPCPLRLRVNKSHACALFSPAAS